MKRRKSLKNLTAAAATGEEKEGRKHMNVAGNARHTPALLPLSSVIDVQMCVL